MEDDTSETETASETSDYGSETSGFDDFETKSSDGKAQRYDAEDRENMLKIYILVPQGIYQNVAFRSHVRYVDKKGTFYAGGYVIANTVEAGGDRRKLVLRNTLNPKMAKSISWTLWYDNIDQLYVKGTTATQALQTHLMTVSQKINENFQVLAKRLESLTAAVNEISRKIARI